MIYSPSQISVPERMCSLYTPVYVMLGPFGLKVWNDTEARNGTTVSWKIGAWEDRAVITIWMDGRAHPSPYAPHEPPNVRAHPLRDASKKGKVPYQLCCGLPPVND